MPDKDTIKEVDYDVLPDIQPEVEEVDYAVLPDITEPKKKELKLPAQVEIPLPDIESRAISQLPKEGFPELVSPEELAAREESVSASTITSPLSDIEIQFTEDQLAQGVERDQIIEDNFANISDRTGVPVEIIKNAVEIIRPIPDKEYLGRHYSSAFARGLYTSVGEGFNMLAGAHSLVQDALGLPKKVNPFKDVADIFDPELFTQAPDDAMGDLFLSAGAILPDIAASHYMVPSIAARGLSKLTAGAVKTIPKFAAYLGAKEGLGTFEETGDVIEATKDGLEGFKTGLYYQALGMPGTAIGNLATKMVSSEVAGTALDAAATSILFGVSGMAETGDFSLRTFASGAGIGLGFAVPKARAVIERVATKKAMGSYFTSTPELEAEARQVKKSNTELRKEAIDLRIQAQKAEGQEKNQLLLRAAKLENVISIRAITEFIKESPEEPIEAIRNDKSLSQEAADYYIKKVQDTFLENNEEIQKVKPQLQEVEKLNKRNAEIDQMDVSDIEKEVLKSKNTEKVSKLAEEIETIIKAKETEKEEGIKDLKGLLKERSHLEKEGESVKEVDKKIEDLYYETREMITREEKAKLRKEKPEKDAGKVQEKIEGVGPEEGLKGRGKEVQRGGVRDITEADKLEAGKKKEIKVEKKPVEIKKEIEVKPEEIKPKELTEEEIREKPVLVKAGPNIFGITLDNNAAVKLWRKHLTAQGNLPKPVFDRWVKSRGRVRKQLLKSHFLTTDFDRALGEAYGTDKLGQSKVSEEQLNKINEALTSLGEKGKRRKKALAGVPEELHEPLIEMRNHIDALSRELVRSGLIEGDLEAKIQENLGFYLTRTYRAHNEKEWNWENVPEEAKNRAISWMREEFPDLSNERIDGELRNLMFRNDGPIGAISKGRLGEKDLGILQRKKDIPVELRNLLGEYKDPAYNYATSVAKMAELIERQKFLEDVKKEGKGKFLFTKPTGEFSAPIVREGDYRFHPLSWKSVFEGKEGERVEIRKSYYTTPEIAEAFQTFNEATPMSPWLRAYVKYMNVPVKYGKTILSPVTHNRNYWANYLFHVNNGRFIRKPDGTLALAHKTIFRDLKTSSDKEFREYLLRLTELNVIGESVRSGEVRDAVRDAGIFQDFDKRGDAIFKKAGKKTLKGLEKLYQVEDDVHKIIAFEVEKSRYEPVIKKENPNTAPDEIIRMTEEKAAEITRATMPTYSMVSKFIRELRRFPLTGTFVSFPAEVIRTTGNTMDLAVKELQNPNTRNIGIKRIAGMMFTATATGMASTMVRKLTGIDKQDEKDIRRFVAPWSKNSDLMIKKDKGGGVYSYIDVGFSDPYNYLKKPITAILKGDDPGEAAWEGVKQLVEPFLGEELLASRIADINRNSKKETGAPVYNKQDLLGDQLKDKWLYLWGGVQPGAIYTGKRIAKSFQDDVNEYGRGLTPQNELTNLFLGLRSNDLDVKRSMSFKLRRGGSALNDAFDIYDKTLFDKKMSDKDRQAQLEKAETAVSGVLSELNEDYKAAIRLGVDQEELDRMIKKTRVGAYPAHRRVRRAIMSGEFPGIDPKTGKLKFADSGELVGD